MGLFGGNKDKIEEDQNKEIKEATINPPLENTNLETVQNSNPINNNNNNSQLPPLENFDLNSPNEEIKTNNNNLDNSSHIEQIKTNNLNSMENTYGINSNIENNSVDFDKIQEMIDETVEKLIEEKWEKLLSSVDKVLKWKDKQENQMILIKEDIVSIKENLEKIEAKIMNKISSYDRNILDVNSEIKAMEKVFQKVTPTLINNVNELSRIADDFKGIKLQNKILDNEKN